MVNFIIIIKSFYDFLSQTVSVTFWSNPAERLVARALNKWRSKALKADNTSCVVVLIDPLGPSKLTLLKRKRQELLSGGEIINPHFHKMPSLPMEVDYRSKSASNQNANCSLSDSHIRVTDESIIRHAKHPTFSQPIADDSDPYLSLRKLVNDYEEKMGDGGQVSSMIKALKEAMKRPEEDDEPVKDVHVLRHCTYPASTEIEGVSSVAVHTGRLHSHSSQSVEQGTLEAHKRCNGAGKASIESHVYKKCTSILEDSKEDEDSDIDVTTEMDAYDIEFPIPPPSTPATGATDEKAGDSLDDSLHSSMDVTDAAFSLASDESLGSSDMQSRHIRPPTPNSAPAKLTTANRRSRKSVVKRQLISSYKQSKPLSKVIINQMPPPISSSNQATLPPPFPKDNPVSKKSVATSHPLRTNSVSEKSSPLKQVYNTASSMTDIITPKSSRDNTRSASCSGLTPDMDMLMVPKNRKTNQASSTLNSTMAKQLLSTIMAEDKEKYKAVMAGSTLQSNEETSMIVEDPELPLSSTINLPSDPFKQLNKTGHIRKTGSKRFSNFLKASKISIDHMFRKNKQSSSSTGKLEMGVKNQGSTATKNTSVSTSKLADIMQARLPDITIGHLTDITLDASTLTAGDLTNLSALSAEDSMLFANNLDKGHYSMVEESSQGKKTKHRKGFLQKTRFTLRRAHKAAKKAFMPENHQPVNQKPPGTKRKSDEFLPTPELKRRKQLMTNKV